MIHIRFSEADTQLLEDEFRRCKDAVHRDRLQIVRLAARGRPRHQIADDLGVTTRTVPRWLNRYLEHGLAGLWPRKAKGTEAKIPPDMAEEVRRWVIQGPQAQGLDRANWTHAELAEHLVRPHGIRASRSAMQRFCRKLGIRVYRPTYRFLRADPAKQQAAREDLAGLKRGRKPANWSC